MNKKAIALLLGLGVVLVLSGCPKTEPPTAEEVQPKSEMNKPSTGNPNEAAPGALVPGQTVAPQSNALPMPPGKGGK